MHFWPRWDGKLRFHWVLSNTRSSRHGFHPNIVCRCLTLKRLWRLSSSTSFTSIRLQVPGDKQVTVEKIISELDTSPRPRLILRDNFETPLQCAGGTQKQVEKKQVENNILRRLARLRHVVVLVTMRGRYPPCGEAIKWQSRHHHNLEGI